MTKLERLIHSGKVQLIGRDGVVIGKLTPNPLPKPAMVALQALREQLNDKA